LKNTTVASMKSKAYNFLLIISAFLIIFVLGEFSLRVVHLVKYKRPLFSSKKGESQEIYTDKKLGWRATEGYSNKNYKNESSTSNYQKITTNENGFRYFGNTQSSNIKIFIIGDSFSQATNVSDDKTYYAIMAHQLPKTEVFAYGCGGYGSLQEFMILDEFLEKIKPQIIILQYCSNDFINNDFELERKSYKNNNGVLRPYLNMQGKIFYKNPNHLYFIPEFLLENSRFINYINLRVNKLLSYINRNKGIENEIMEVGPSHPEFKRSTEITKKILGMLKERSNKTPVLTFCADAPQPFYDEFKRISGQKGLSIIDGIPQAIRKYEEQGIVVRGEDGAHWNDMGHQIVASYIIDYLKNHNYLQ
jgi:hypothetical protein